MKPAKKVSASNLKKQKQLANFRKRLKDDSQDSHPLRQSISIRNTPDFANSLKSTNLSANCARQLTAVIEREDDVSVALCPEVDIASQGDTVESAKKNLVEALELF